MLPAHPARLCETAPWTRVRAHLLALFGAGLLTLSACGGGSGNGGSANDNDGDDTAACTSSTCGEIVIALTDADGDFLSYAVDVVSIELEKASGAIVETLPTRQRVDFADLVDVTELVTSATVPNGVYVRATVRLDYGDAQVSVEQGGLPAEATVVDADGVALGVVDVELALDNANHVVVAPGIPALLQLDFDLAATHEVDLATAPVTVIADPVLVASVEPLDEREFRVRGPLVSVDESAGSYLIDLRPFNHPSARLGRLNVLTTAETSFDVDGVELDQAAGLAAMAALGANAPTAAHGVYDVDAREFTADRVLAGDSVPGARFDGVIGNVMARSTDTLTVRGGTFVRTDGGTRFARGEITVLVGPDTRVAMDGGGGVLLGIEAISVGQRILALGEASGSDDGPTLDATAGRVRLHRTHVSGTVLDALPGQVTVDLFAIDGRDPMAFDFAGTGIAPASDADPDAYEIATGLLDVAGFTAGDPMRAFGFVMPFGAAPPDFEGRTLVSYDELRAWLGVGWGVEGTTAPFLSMGADGFVLDPANDALGLRHHLKVGPWVQDITQLASPVTIVPATEGRTLYAIARFRRVEMYRDFAEFADRVAELLGGGAALRGLAAHGSFDAGATTLTAHYVAVSFTAP